MSTVLLGRDNERESLDLLLRGVRAGRSGVLVVRGEAGVGKTALLQYLFDRASGCRVERAAGVQAEMELAFAGLQVLCRSMLDRLESLPAPQRDAVGVAFGLVPGPPPDRFLVSLAVLGLLSEVAEERPLVCVVDDAQWLDRASAQTLAFVARRLLAESVAMVFAVREPSEVEELVGLPELVVDGLADDDARELLGSVIGGRLDDRVVDRIVAETDGNPLALMELPAALSADELAGGFGVSGAQQLSAQVEASFLRRAEPLPHETRTLLLLAAAEPVGEPALLWRAAGLIGLGADAAAPAEAVGLLAIDTTVRFRHPLVRSAIYGAAPLQEKRAVHMALAEATDVASDPDRRAWHRAMAALEPDEALAAELEHSASRAGARGGVAAAAAFLERAAALSPDPDARAERALAAAQAKQSSGAPEAALRLLRVAEAGPPDERRSAQVELLRGRIAAHRRRGADATPLLLNAARRLETIDPSLAREVHLEALWAASIAGRLGGGMRDPAEAARAAPSGKAPPRPADLLLDGLASRFTDGYPAGSPGLKLALRAFGQESARPVDDFRWPWLACRAAAELFDDETFHQLSVRQVQTARDTGALTALPLSLNYLSAAHVLAGELAAARACLDEADAISVATGNAPIATGQLLLAGYQGRPAEVLPLIESATEQAVARGEGTALTFAELAAAVLHNGLGGYDAAIAPAERASADADLGTSTWILPELVEAAARGGQPGLAEAALERLAECTRAAGTDWALGIEARCRALLGQGSRADDLYREAIERLGRCRVRIELARAHLAYGEWLRRERRRTEAREHLRRAHQLLTRMGAEAFAGRAERELRAAGERTSRGNVETGEQLTAQEAQIARMARDGLSNQEIAMQLFISPKTVEYHLRKVFTKLGITTRNHLDRVLGNENGSPGATRRMSETRAGD